MMSSLPQKLPLRRLEFAVRKFTDIAIPLHLDLLNKHRTNIEKFQRLEQWGSVHKEQVNARRTVQQLKTDLVEMDMVERQVADQDLPTFLKQVDPIRSQAIKALEDFLASQDFIRKPMESDTGVVGKEAAVPSEEDQVKSSWETSAQLEEQLPVPDTASLEAAEKSKAQLRDDLLELNHMIHRFYNLVNEQQEPVDRIEDNLEFARENIHEGTIQLGRAAKLKAALIPLTGAVIGGCVAGPLGLMAGFKLGGLAAAIGGGLIGYQGAKYIGHRKKAAADEEILMLSSSHRHEFLSLPDLKAAVMESSRPKDI